MRRLSQEEAGRFLRPSRALLSPAEFVIIEVGKQTMAGANRGAIASSQPAGYALVRGSFGISAYDIALVRGAA